VWVARMAWRVRRDHRRYVEQMAEIEREFSEDAIRLRAAQRRLPRPARAPTPDTNDCTCRSCRYFREVSADQPKE
jgi:hypothetical protein